jgi:hypothetical protein
VLVWQLGQGIVWDPAAGFLAATPTPLEHTMKKLTLNLDELTVDSFDMAETETAARGTVQGHYISSGDALKDFAKTWLIACDA